MTTSTEIRQPSRVNRRRMNGVTAGLLASVLVWVFVAGLKADPRTTQALRTPQSIITVTIGTEPLIVGAVWQQTLLRMSPKLGSVVGGTVLTCPKATPGCLVVWEHFGRAIGWSGPPPMLTVECADELGHRMRQTVFSDDFLELNGDYVFPFVIKNYPNRGRSVGISASDAFAENPVRKTIWVPNPHPGPFPVWKADKEPSTKRDGDLVGTLREYRHSRAPDGGPGSTDDLLRLTVHGSPGGAADWSAEKLQLEDATGNSWVVTPEGNWLQSETRRGELHVTCPSLDLSGEEVFKVRLTLARIRNLPAAETATLHDLPMPTSGVLLTQRRSARIQGCTAEVTHEIGKGASHNLGWSSDSTDLAVWVRKPAADRVLRIRPPGASTWQSPDFRAISGCYCVSMPDSLAGKRISLQVGLTRARTLEFLVRPGMGHK